MEPPPPPLAAAPAPTLAAAAAAPPAHLSYPESVDSSPRSRAATDSWEAPAAAGAAAATDPLPPKLRLMCSYGGHIVPRPHDKALCYVGGDTRIVVVDRNVTNLSSLSGHLSKNLLNNRPFTLKYQLPSEDLDSLITVSTDEDLENMIDEYDRTMLNSSSASKPSRLRLFLFPSKPDSSQSIGPILESSTKSEDWFLNALNNSGVLNRGFSDSAPACLVNLDDEVGINNVEISSRDADGSSSLGNEKSVKQAQDVHSVPDSPMLETTSSFGSTSSSPSIANLPSIRVQVEENVIGSGGGGGGGGGVRVMQDQKLGIEEQFAQMVMGTGVGQKPADDGFGMMSSPPTVPAAAAVTVAPVGSAAMAPPGDYSNRVFSDDERSDHGVPLGFRKLPLAQQQPQPQPPQSQQKPSGVLDLPSPDSVSSDGSLTNPLARPKPVIFQDHAAQMSLGINRGPTNTVDPNINFSEQSTGVQLQQHIQDARYVLQPQIDQRQPQQHQQPQQQFVQAVPHYIQHHPQGSMPVAGYYTVYPSQQHQVQQHQLDQHYPMYYMPVNQPQAYNLSAQQSNPNEAATANPSNRPQATPNSAMIPQSAAYANPIRNPPGVKADLASGVYRMASGAASPLLQVPAGQHQQQYVGYSQVHHPSQSVAPSSGAPATYGYEFANPAPGQIYYAQHLAPSLPSQYQTMTATNAGALPEASGQLSGDSIKQQMRTS